MANSLKLSPAGRHLPKRLLALTALALASQMASAQVTVPPIKFYGFLNAQIESVEAKGGTTPYEKRGRISDGNSRLGISGSIPISDTTKAIWQLEGSLNEFEQGGVNDQGTSSTLVSRNTFVGIEDVNFGRLIVGNMDSVYRSLVGSGGELGGNLGLSSLGLDLWNNTTAQLTGNTYSLFGRGESRMKNSVHYLSPVYAGFQVGASLGFDESRSDSVNHNRFSLAAKYSNGGLSLGLGYDRQSNTGVDVDNLEDGYGFKTASQAGAKTEFVKAVASYKLPTRTYIGVGVERARYGYEQFVAASGSNIYSTINIGRMTQTGVMASIAQEIGDRTVLMFSAGRIGNLKNTVFGSEDDYAATQFSFGAKYKLNQYLSTYAFVTKIKNHAQQSLNLGQSPLYSVNASSSSAYLSPGDSPRAIGVGLIASF